MKVDVQFFSRLRDLAGAGHREIELPPGATVADLLARLYSDIPGMASWDAHLLIAIGLEYADRAQALTEGDSVSIMPPVQGG